MMHVDLIQAAKGALFVLETPLVDSRFDASARAEALRKAIAEFERLAEAPQPKKARAKRAPAPVDPDEVSPYAPARFVPLKPYRASMRDMLRTVCEVTFEDGARIRAYALREPGKPLDIGRPARAAVEKYRHRKGVQLIELTPGSFSDLKAAMERADVEPHERNAKFYGPPAPQRAEIGFDEFTAAIPEIVELRDTETGDIFDIALANSGTATLRAALN